MSRFIETPFFGRMMDQPLLIQDIIRHADLYFGETEIVSRLPHGDVHRYTVHDCHRRARQLANALGSLGISPGDRVATLAWNGYRHLELYYAVSGSGAVLHTVNPRLFAEQLVYIINHAQDKVLFFDTAFVDLVQEIAPRCPSVKTWVALCDPAQLREFAVPGDMLAFEHLLAGSSQEYEWPVFDERTASSLCYTSGTTGNPKGVLYSHRSTLLHCLSAIMPDRFGLSSRDCVAPIVPMFHVNAWGLPYSCLMTGAKLVLPGAALDGASVHALFEAEGVTFSAGVPTVWNNLLAYVRQHGGRFSTLKRVVVGGAACSPALRREFVDEHGVAVVHAWGMTETSPLATTSALQSKHARLVPEARDALLQKQGSPIYGIDIRLVDEQGVALPRDGRTPGHLQVRGPWVASCYYGEDAADSGAAWFDTGDVATIDPEGYLQLTDRSKDVIKSGGEWIGSIDLENLAAGHPSVHQAACIGVRHSKWDERPLLVVVKRVDGKLDRDELLDYFNGKVARWWIPDDVVFVDALPLGSTGKVLKNTLREQYKDYRLPTDV